MRPIGLIFLVALVVELSLKFHFQTCFHKKMRLPGFCTLKLLNSLINSSMLSNSFGFSMENFIVGRHYSSNLHICKFCAFLHRLGSPAHCETG